MDKREEELKKKLEEDLKKKMGEVEFNNVNEDMEVNKEEEEKDFLEEKSKKKNILIIVLVSCVVLLLIILLYVLLFSGSKNDSSKENNSKDENGNVVDEEDKKDENAPKVIDQDDYDYSLGKVYFNKYVFVPSKDSKNTVVTDLDNNVLFYSSNNYTSYEGNSNSVFLVNAGDSYTVKRLKDNRLSDYFSGSANGVLLEKGTDKLLGLYKTENNNDVLYTFDGDSYNTVKLSGFASFDNSTNKDKVKYLYSNKYIVIYTGKEPEKEMENGIKYVFVGWTNEEKLSSVESNISLLGRMSVMQSDSNYNLGTENYNNIYTNSRMTNSFGDVTDEKLQDFYEFEDDF